MSKKNKERINKRKLSSNTARVFRHAHLRQRSQTLNIDKHSSDSCCLPDSLCRETSGNSRVSSTWSRPSDSPEWIIPVRVWKFPFPNILFFSGVLVERIILSTTVQFSKVFTSPSASAIISSAANVTVQTCDNLYWCVFVLGEQS